MQTGRKPKGTLYERSRDWIGVNIGVRIREQQQSGVTFAWRWWIACTNVSNNPVPFPIVSNYQSTLGNLLRAHGETLTHDLYEASQPKT